MDDRKLQQIVDYFGLPGTLTEAGNFGNGHINETLRLATDHNGQKEQYVLQKLNRYVFRHPEQVMDNLVLVTTYLKKKIAEYNGDPERETLTVVFAKNGSSFFKDEEGNYWRITKLIDNAKSFDTVSCPEDLYVTGKAFGNFQYMLSDFPADRLYETIPDFHNTAARYQQFAAAVEADAFDRAGSCREEIRFLLERKKIAEDPIYARLPLRVTHNDTKINNLLFDDATRQPICVLDMDTVMPGPVMIDFGDAIRTGACTAAEDEPDCEKVACDPVLFEAFTRGFLEGTNGTLTTPEKKTLPLGALRITYEQALRFLTDYLSGNVYYKVKYEEHNLVRARTQIRMVADMEAKWGTLQRIAEKYSG